MKNFKWIYLITALLALIANDVWARGGHGGGGGHSISGGGHSFGGGRGRHIGGGHRHFRGGFGFGGHRHFRGGFGFGGHRHFRGGFGFGGHRHFRGGFFNNGFGYGGFGYRGYPSTVIVPSTPPVYIQRETVTPVQQQTNYWHYCRNPDGYYPYVKQCPGGWLQVVPQPSAS